MQKRETAIEVKVGALVLFSTALLVAFVIILGDFTFEDGHVIYVDFDNAGGLKPGADVAISGIKSGQVKRLEFLGGEYDQDVGREVMVRAHLLIDSDKAYAIRRNSQFYITTQGVLGEKYVEITTTGMSEPEVPAEAKLRGVDPPRMELLLAKGAEILTGLSDAINKGDVPLEKLIADIDSLVVHSDELISDNKNTIGNIIGNVETASKDVTEITAMVRDDLGEGGDISATLRNTRSLTGKLDRRVDPLVNKTMSTLGRVESVAGTVDEITTGKRDEIEGSIDNIYAATQDVAGTTGDVKAMVSQIKSGKGSVGALLNDDEVYDDLKELMRELKRRPWKIIWKE